MRPKFKLIERKPDKIHDHAVVLKGFHKLLLNQFKTNTPILHTLKQQKTFGFLVFSGGIK